MATDDETIRRETAEASHHCPSPFAPAALIDIAAARRFGLTLALA